MSVKVNNRLEKVKKLSRRQFLKNAGLLMGGAAVSSIALTTACSSASNTTTSSTKTTTPNNTTTTQPTTTTTLPPAEGFVYETPTEPPPKMEIPGCTTFTATDRKYIIEHMWIRMVAQGIVAIGITEKMSELMDLIYTFELPPVGKMLEKGGHFGYATAGKMNVEFVSPVSGEVKQNNNAIYTDLEMMVNADPYVKGWLVTIRLTKPEEWDELLTPQEYTDLNSKVTG